MKTLAMSLLAGIAAMGFLTAQGPTPPTQQPAPVRILGRPNSPQEMDAFNALAATQASGERIRLGQEFLNAYPNSGLSSFVHHIIASAYGMTDPQQYVFHAESALQELPRSPGLLATLAFIYAETGKTALGAERGETALELIQGLEKPPQMSQTDWLLQKLEVGGQSNYAIGRNYLDQAKTSQDKAAKLGEAAKYFMRAMEQLPDDPYSSFRLGETYLQMEEIDQALASFARTVAVGGSVGAIAGKRLEELYELVHSNTEGLSELLTVQAAELERARAARKAMLDVMAQPTASTTSSGSPPPPPPPEKP